MTSAVSTSRALFDAADLVVLAPEGNVGGLLLGASAAVGLGVPLLVEPQSSVDGADLVAEELERLGATTVLGVGPAGGMTERRRPEGERDSREVVAVPAAPAAIEEVTGLDLVGDWYWGTTAYTLRLASDGVLVLGEPGLHRGSRFRPVGDGWVGLDGYHEGEPLVAVRDADGRVGHLDLGSFRFSRTPYDPASDVPGDVHPDRWH